MSNVKHIIFAFVMLCLFSCKAQHENITVPIKKIDLKKYSTLQREGYYQSIKSDTITDVYSSDGKYIESKYPPKNNTTIVKSYSYKTGILMEEGQKFSKVEVGITKIYDSNGKVYKEIDNDAPYAFSLDQIRNLLKVKFNIDVTERNSKRSVERYYNSVEDRYIYVINEPVGIFTGRLIRIDGTTGEIISDTIVEHGDY